MKSFETNFRIIQKQQKKKEQQWTMKAIKDENQVKLEQQFSQILDKLVLHFPELISRMEHAGSALLIEINRGFFLPFCTVALASLARIRTLILKLGRLGLAKLKELSDSVNFLSISQELFVTIMDLFLESSSEIDQRRVKKEEETKLLASMGIHLPKSHQKHSNPQTVNNDGEQAINETIADSLKEVDTIKEKGNEDFSMTLDVLDDIGESMGSTGFVEKSNKMQGNASKHKSMDHIDRNTAILESYRQLGSEATEKKVKKRKESSPAKNDQKERKKKKKKKSKKGDFFDSLFD